MTKIEKIKELDFSKPIKINKIYADNDSVKFYYNTFKSNSSPDTTETEIWKAINNLIIMDNVFNRVMSVIITSYKITIDATDKEKIIQNLIAKNEHLKNASKETINTIAQRILEKKMVFAEIQKEFNISVSDDEVKQSLDYYYKKTNKPIREVLNDPKQFEEIRNQLLEDKITKFLCSKFQVEFDWDSIKKSTKPTDVSSKMEEK